MKRRGVEEQVDMAVRACVSGVRDGRVCVSGVRDGRVCVSGVRDGQGFV